MVTIPKADELIQQSRPLREMVRFFPNKVGACQYYANKMSTLHGEPETYCADCGLETTSDRNAFLWRANLHTAKTVLLSFLFSFVAIFAHHLYSRWIVVQFTTFHRLCPACNQQYRKRRLIKTVLDKILFAFLILFLILTTPAIIMAIASFFIAPEGKWMMVGLSLVGLAVLSLVGWGFQKTRIYLMPKRVRSIGRYPFILYGVQDRT